MVGRPPKPDGAKRNRSRPAVPWTTLPAEGRKGPAPRLPSTAPGGVVWRPATRAWWAALWRKPQAVMWDQSGSSLHALAGLKDKGFRGAGTASDVRATRLAEADHGLDPRSMLALRWRIQAEPVDPDAVEVEGEVPLPPATGRVGFSRERRQAVIDIINAELPAGVEPYTLPETGLE